MLGKRDKNVGDRETKMLHRDKNVGKDKKCWEKETKMLHRDKNVA